jgi:hypothetical protein
MKRTIVISIVFLAVGLGGCNQQKDRRLASDVVNNPNTAEGRETKNVPEITFEKTIHDFGKLIQGEIVIYNFKFKNTGSADLLITDVISTCGCTVTEYPKEPIKPGQEKKLEVTFDSNNRRGFQSKMISVLTNAQPSTTILKIKAKVIEP